MGIYEVQAKLTLVSFGWKWDFKCPYFASLQPGLLNGGVNFVDFLVSPCKKFVWSVSYAVSQSCTTGTLQFILTHMSSYCNYVRLSHNGISVFAAVKGSQYAEEKADGLLFYSKIRTIFRGCLAWRGYRFLSHKCYEKKLVI